MHVYTCISKRFFTFANAVRKYSDNNMGIVERKERQKREIRDSILISAWQLVNEEGWQNLSIRKIADAIEYSVPVVYDHFENKEAILTVFNRQGFQLLGDKLRDTKAKHSDAKKQLDAITYAYWDFAFEQRAFYQLMFGLGMPGCESLATVPELSAFIEVINTTVEQVIKDGNNKDANLRLKVHSFWSMIHGLVSISLMVPPSPGNVTHEQMNKMVLADFIKGFIKGLIE